MPDVQRLFLLDGLGALLSTTVHGVLIPRYEAAFGMPRPVLYGLTAWAFLSMLYSLGHAWLVRPLPARRLRWIALANTSYAGLALGLIVYRWASLTPLGVGYFLAEIAVVLFLARLEFNASRS